MTGRELIMLILTYHLEDEELFEDKNFQILGMYTIEQAAVKLNIGVESIKAQCAIDAIRHIEIGDKTYIYIEE